MKDLGLYYSKELNTIILGFKVPGQYRDRLVGRVIGHTIQYEMFGFHAYNVGYEYSDWSNDFIYLGRYTTFTTLKGYMDFLMSASVKEIEGYFKAKPVIEEYIKSYVVFRKKDGMAWYERRYNKI